MTNYKLADDLREGVQNSGCEGVSHDVVFAVCTLSKEERRKLREELERQDARYADTTY